MYADSLQTYIIVPILLSIILGIIFHQKLSDIGQTCLKFALAFLGLIVLTAFLYAFFSSNIYIDLRNSQDGFLRAFQAQRYYWLLPGLWWACLGVCAGIFWPTDQAIAFTSESTILNHSALKIPAFIILVAILIPSMILIKNNSLFYMSVNQLNNGSSITGYITWEAYYSDDIMTQIENDIGKDMSSYRIANLGINPTPSLMHGFYTIDGYTNNYPLSYKYEFRKIIEDELNISPAETVSYFDEWGSRCYLFNSQSGTAFMISKNSNVKYTNLKFNWEQMKNMNVQYLFSAGEITDADEQGLKLLGYYSSETSYWGIWVYELE